MKIVLAGVCGYGHGYLKYLLDQASPAMELTGIVDTHFENCPSKERVAQAGIPVYTSLPEFYRKHTADLAVIVTPPFVHREQSLCALENGSYVLCEKPIASCVEDAKAMLEAEKTYGKFIAIGYQWSFSQAIRDLKRDILDGLLGKPLSMKTLIVWPRNFAYYTRGGGWAGRSIRHGTPIFDSIASNACAHYIHNMFFLLGNTMESSDLPVSAEAECLRANAIETFDTCIIKMKTREGVPLYFAATHAAKDSSNPEFVYEFENATVTFRMDDDSQIIATFKDGTVRNYSDPFQNGMRKLTDCIAAIENGTHPVCTAATAIPHARLIQALHRNITVTEFPEEKKTLCPDRIFVEDLGQTILQCYQTGSLFCECGYDFTQPFSFDI